MASAIEALGLNYVVVTSVDRDDLHDGARRLRGNDPQHPRASARCRIEVLIPDFQGSAALQTVLDARPDVLNHNTETVPRLYGLARSGGRYPRSLELLDPLRSYRRRSHENRPHGWPWRRISELIEVFTTFGASAARS